jgi:hypothetical protein
MRRFLLCGTVWLVVTIGVTAALGDDLSAPYIAASAVGGFVVSGYWVLSENTRRKRDHEAAVEENYRRREAAERQRRRH